MFSSAYFQNDLLLVLIGMQDDALLFICIAFQHHINQPDKDNECATKTADTENQNAVIGG